MAIVASALLNRHVAAIGKPPVNHKRVYRLMWQNGLLLARHTGTGGSARTTAWSGPYGRTCAGVRMYLKSRVEWREDPYRFRARYLRSGNHQDVIEQDPAEPQQCGINPLVDRHHCRDRGRAHSGPDGRGGRAPLRSRRSYTPRYGMADR
jgi:hypothetical protein